MSEAKDDDGHQSDDSTEDEGYLHPSLQGSSRPTQPTYEGGSSGYNSYPFAYQPPVPPNSAPSRTANSLYSKLAENLMDKIVVNESYQKPKVIESKAVRYDLSTNSDPASNRENAARLKNTKEDSQPQKPAKNSSHQKSIFELVPEIPADIKLIIEKLAQYVAKNGDEFEKTVKGRNESRFEFLNSGHKFHFYYVKTKFELQEEKRKREEESAKKNGSSGQATGEASASSLPSDENASLNEASKTVQPFVISAKKSTSFKEDLQAKLLKEKQEERKRKAAEFLNKLKTQKSSESVKPPKEEHADNRMIGPQLPADKRREDLRNTPSPLREFYEELDIKVEHPMARPHVFDEIRSINDKLKRDDEACSSPEQTSFKKSKTKTKQYRARERSSSRSERSDSDERGRSKPTYDAYKPRTARSRSGSRPDSRTVSRTVSRSPTPRQKSYSRSCSRSRSKSSRRSSRHRNRRSRSRSPKRKKSHRSKKRKRSKERKRDRRRSKDRSRSRERSKRKSRDRSRDRSKDRSDRSTKRSRGRS